MPGPRRRVLAGAGLVLGVALVRLLVLDTVVVGSGSMAPTYCSGDRLVVLRAVADRTPRAGDVVTFANDTGTGTEGTGGSRGAERWLKRVVAVGGQTVMVDDGVLVVDGAPVVEPFVDHATVDGTFFRRMTVPHGSVFVLGDGREFSTDSRDFGPVPLSVVQGRVVARVWSSCAG